MDIFKNKRYWKNLNKYNFENYVKSIFNYYKNINGFPYYPTNFNYRKKEFEKLKKYDSDNLINFENGIIKQTMHGLGLAWSYFPQSFRVRCNNIYSPYDAFIDDGIFEKVIRKRLQLGDNISDSGIRKMLKIS